MHHRTSSTQSLNSPSAPLSPRISVEEHIGGSVVHKKDIETGPDLPPLDEDKAYTDTAKSDDLAESNPEFANMHVQMPNLPPLPPPPMKPAPLDLTIYPDPAAQNVIRREHERQMKAYEQALEDREAALRDRKDLENSLRALAIKEKRKAEHPGDQTNDRQQEATREDSAKSTETDITPKIPSADPGSAKSASISQIALAGQSDQSNDITSPTEASSMFSIDREESRSIAPEAAKRKKDRKFCALPKKINGERDPLWVRVYMENHDEVSAHTGLFYMNETYERLVGDVGAKIEEWVRDEMTRRMIEEYAS